MVEEQTKPESHVTPTTDDCLESSMPPFSAMTEAMPDSTNPPFHNLPSWAKVIAYIGFPIVVALILLWSFTKQISDDRRILIENQAILKTHNMMMYNQYIGRLNVDAAMLRTLSQICSNGARTQQARNECAIAVVPVAPMSPPTDFNN